MKQLSKTERQEIYILKGKGYSLRAIAKALERSVSTVSRELKRNSVMGKYSPEKAQMKSYQRRYWVTKPPPKLWKMEWRKLGRFLKRKITQKYPWSVEQIVGTWNKNNPTQTISVPSIYNYLYRWEKSLCKYLPTKRYRRKTRKNLKKKRELIPNRVWIDERPKSVDKRNSIGHWEGDTLGSKKGESATILASIERKSRFLVAQVVPNRKPKKIAQRMKKWQELHSFQTLTIDSGIEFRNHEDIGCDTYFCHPYSSWEKGQVEYAMKLLRKFFPKKSSLKNIPQQKLTEIVHALNNTPRKCLNFQTPSQVFFQNVDPPNLSP